jgi:hypothetical protein
MHLRRLARFRRPQCAATQSSRYKDRFGVFKRPALTDGLDFPSYPRFGVLSMLKALGTALLSLTVIAGIMLGWASSNSQSAALTLQRRGVIPGLARDALPLPPASPPSFPPGPLTVSVQIELVVNEISSGSPTTPLAVLASAQGALPTSGPVTYLALVGLDPHPGGNSCSWKTVFENPVLEVIVSTPVNPAPDELVAIEFEGGLWYYIVTCPGLDAPTIFRSPAVANGQETYRSVGGWMGLIFSTSSSRSIQTPAYTAGPGCLHNRGVRQASNQFGTATVVVDIFTAPCALPPPPPPPP